MRKKIFTTGVALGTLVNIYAGGLLTNTNQNVAFLRNPARGASIEIDAAFTNPAGLAFLKKDGFYFSLNNQSAFQTRTITADFAPFAGFGGKTAKEFEGEAKAMVIPNLQAAYKKGDWVFSANIGIAGGGGTLDFKKGVPSFESTVAIVPVFLNAAQPGLGIGGYSLESQLKGSSIIYGVQLGISHAISEHFSAYMGYRYNYVDNGYEGFLKNVNIGMGGNMVPAANIMANPAFAALRPLVNDKNLDCKQTGFGIAPILGFDYNCNKFNLGIKYEFQTGLKLTNETTVNTTGVKDYNDGGITPYDLPALLAVGAQYDILPRLTFSAGYHHFFDSNAKMANGKQKFINGGVNEYLAGIEYKTCDYFLISCGAQLTRQGVTDNYQSDLSFSLNSYSLGFGGAINITKNIRVNLAYFFTNYDDWEKKTTDYGKINSLTQVIPATPGTDIFGRTNQAFGIGLDFRF